MIVRLSVIIVHSFLLVVAVVHKQRFLGGPPELFLYCAKFSIRGNNLGCARRLSTHATYNYAFTVNDGYCFQCRVIDSNVTTAEELLLGGPHLFSGDISTKLSCNLLTDIVLWTLFIHAAYVRLDNWRIHLRSEPLNKFAFEWST